MNATNHIFQSILATICPPGADPAAERMAAYVQALRRFDWGHEFSDSGDVRRRGAAALVDLYAEQAITDPSGEVWLCHMAKGHGHPAPRIFGAHPYVAPK